MSHMCFGLSVILSGISLGMIIGLMAIGLSLIFGFQVIFNFAQHAFFMFGAYVGFIVLQKLGVSFWMALPIAFAAVGSFGIIVERGLIRRLYGVDPSATLVFTYGLGLAMVEIVKWSQGLEFKHVAMPLILADPAPILGCQFPSYRLFIIGVGGFLFLAVWLLLNKTATGLVIRAGISDRDMVRALGINIRRAFTLVFGLGVGLSGVGGIVAAPITGVSPEMGIDLMVLSFVVIIIGGMGSFGGTLIASLICGLLSSIFTLISAPLANIVIFIFMALFLLLKPGGLFGQVTRYEY